MPSKRTGGSMTLWSFGTDGGGGVFADAGATINKLLANASKIGRNMLALLFRAIIDPSLLIPAVQTKYPATQWKGNSRRQTPKSATGPLEALHRPSFLPPFPRLACRL